MNNKITIQKTLQINFTFGATHVYTLTQSPWNKFAKDYFYYFIKFSLYIKTICKYFSVISIKYDTLDD